MLFDLTEPEWTERAVVVPELSPAALAAGWQPMATAPLDRPVLVYFDHDADPGCEDAEGRRLTTYAAHCEGLSHRAGKGLCVAEFGGEYHEDLSGEGWGPYASVPDWWFVEGSDFEVALFPLAWHEVPNAPTFTGQA